MIRRGIWMAASFLILTTLVGLGWTQPVDDAWKAAMVNAEVSWLVQVAEAFAFVGAFPIPLITIILGATALWLMRQRWGATTWIAVMASAQVLSIVIKVLVDRARPLDALAYEPSDSYPSGHSLVSGAALAIGLALVIGTVWPRRGQLAMRVAVAYTALMAASRTYLRVHWLTDVVGGVLLGSAVVLVVVPVALRRFERDRSAGSIDSSGHEPEPSS